MSWVLRAAVSSKFLSYNHSMQSISESRRLSLWSPPGVRRALIPWNIAATLRPPVWLYPLIRKDPRNSMFFEIQELHITSSAESGFVATNNYLALVQLSMKAVNHRIANSPRERTKYVVRLNIHSGNGVRTSLCCSVLPGAPTYGLLLGTLWMQQHRILVDTYRNFAPGLFKGRKIGIHGEYGAR